LNFAKNSIFSHDIIFLLFLIDLHIHDSAIRAQNSHHFSKNFRFFEIGWGESQGGVGGRKNEQFTGKYCMPGG